MANYSGLWDRQYGVPYLQLGAQIGANINSSEQNSGESRQFSKLLRQRGNRPLARLLYALTGAAAGGSAQESFGQLTSVQGLGDPTSNGGRRTITSVNAINRVTTAGDITLIQALLTQIFGPTIPTGYPTDRGGGGGGKISAANGTYGF